MNKENQSQKKERVNTSEIAILFSMIIATVAFLFEVYFMMQGTVQKFILFILAFVVIFALYICVLNFINLKKASQQHMEEKYEAILKSEKATYLLQRKYFNDIKEELRLVREEAKKNLDEITTTDKSVGKIVMKKTLLAIKKLEGNNDNIHDKFAMLELILQDVQNSQTELNRLQKQIVESMQSLNGDVIKRIENVHITRSSAATNLADTKTDQEINETGGTDETDSIPPEQQDLVYETSEVLEEAAEPAYETSEVLEEAAEPVYEAGEVLEEAAEPVYEASEALEEAAEPVYEASEALEEVAEPVYGNDESSEQFEPTYEPNEPTYSNTEPVYENVELQMEKNEPVFEADIPVHENSVLEYGSGNEELESVVETVEEPKLEEDLELNSLLDSLAREFNPEMEPMAEPEFIEEAEPMMEPEFIEEAEPPMMEPEFIEEAEPPMMEPEFIEEAEPLMMEPEFIEEAEPLMMEPEFIEEAEPPMMEPEFIEEAELPMMEPEFIEEAEPPMMEPEFIEEPEPVMEEKLSMPDLSDPNKVMTPEEIAALIANL